MGRIHLFELEDQQWFPAVIRDAGTAYLQFGAAITGQPRMLAPKIREVLEASGENRLVDLCSGGAGPIPGVVEALAEDGFEVRAVLTDLYPNAAVLEHMCAGSDGRIEYSLEPVNATDVPARLKGLRTMFSAFHHFRPGTARGILQSAVDSGQPIAAFEVVSRHPAVLLGILLAPITVMLTLPFFRPFRWSWLPLTYVIPVIPLFVLWDGLVSCFRVYSTSELTELVEGLDGGDRFEWDIGTIAIPPIPGSAIYCVGRPRVESSPAPKTQ